LEQPLPPALQVAVSIEGILERIGHRILHRAVAIGANMLLQANDFTIFFVPGQEK